ncbi:MAG: ABC transporter permease, partial [Trueperaceae bacterium]
MSERWAVPVLALIALLGLWLAPWASYDRETGSRGAVTLLPNRTLDFTGRTDPLPVPGQGAVLVVSALGLVTVAAAGALGRRRREVAWLAAGGVLIVTAWAGVSTHAATYRAAQEGEVRAELSAALEDPGPRVDVEGIEGLLKRLTGQSLRRSQQEALPLGVRIRRLPYAGEAPGLAAFLVFVVGAFALAFGSRRFAVGERWVRRVTDVAAIPATAILLALAAAAVVVLALQPTPMGSAAEIEGWRGYLAGRLDVLWHAYYTLFSGSLGTFDGFVEALKLATPLIFTGLAVGFGFQAGMFNIGAPGQMTLGALSAALTGIYLPGPTWLVLPASVLAAAVGGGAWGALPGWLKARFGANEVINTILLNFIASSLLLFVLSSSPVFAASALRILLALGVGSAVLVFAFLIPAVRRLAAAAPRPATVVVLLALLGAATVAGWPQPGDGPVTVNLPFKAPGSEPKSVPLQETARLPQLPQLFGLPPRSGSADTTFDAAAWLAVAAAIMMIMVGPRVRLRGRWRRLGGAAVVAVVAYGVAAAFGLRTQPITVPPSTLNVGFLLAIGTAAFMQFFLWRTRWGYELRAVGQAPKAAEYGGASIARSTVMAMAMSGAFAGLTATHYVLGGALDDFSLRQSLPTNDGFDGIAVALLGANNPVGIVLAAFLFGVLKNGGATLNIAFSGLTRDVVNMILALVVLFIAAKGFLPERFTDPIQRAASRRRKRDA